MKTAMMLLTLLTLLLPNAFAQDKGSMSAVRYSPDGTMLAVGGSAGIWLYDTATYEVVVRLTGHTAKITSVAFSPDGETLASSDRGNNVILWDTETGEQKETLTGRYGVAFRC